MLNLHSIFNLNQFLAYFGPEGSFKRLEIIACLNLGKRSEAAKNVLIKRTLRMKEKINLVGFFDRGLTKLNLINYFTRPDLIPESFRNNDLDIEISLFSRKRTVRQNKLLFGYAYQFVINFLYDTTGEEHSKEEIHIHNMCEIQGYKYQSVKIYGKEYLTLERAHSSEMSTKEFSEMYDKFCIWWDEKGCVIPQRDILIPVDAEQLTDNSVMEYGPFAGKKLKKIPDDYLLEIYNNPKRYCPEALKLYIEKAFEL